MPDQDPQDSSPENVSTPSSEDSKGPAHNPGAGCVIVIVALLSLSFLVGFGIWSLFKGDRELSKFTESEAKQTPIPKPEDHVEVANELTAKLERFQTDEGNERDATLTLSPLEINLALATHEEFEVLRGKFSVKEIVDNKLHIDISFPLRGSPTKGGFRYLNGTMVATPELTGGEIILVVDEVRVPDKTVPEGFIGQLSPYRFTETYKEHETLGPWLKRLTSLTLEDGNLVLGIKKGDLPPALEPPKIEREHIMRAAILGGIILVGFVGLMIFAATRKKPPRPEQSTL